MKKKRSAGRIAASVAAVLWILVWCGVGLFFFGQAVFYEPYPGEEGMSIAFGRGILMMFALFCGAGALSAGEAALGLRLILKRGRLRRIGAAASSLSLIQHLWFLLNFFLTFSVHLRDREFYLLWIPWLVSFLASPVLLAAAGSGKGEEPEEKEEKIEKRT